MFRGDLQVLMTVQYLGLLYSNKALEGQVMVLKVGPTSISLHMRNMCLRLLGNVYDTGSGVKMDSSSWTSYFYSSFSEKSDNQSFLPPSNVSHSLLQNLVSGNVQKLTKSDKPSLRSSLFHTAEVRSKLYMSENLLFPSHPPKIISCWSSVVVIMLGCPLGEGPTPFTWSDSCQLQVCRSRMHNELSGVLPVLKSC